MTGDARIEVGMTIHPLEWSPTNVQLFRFSGATWNAHRIHYDSVYAQREGYNDVLVQSHLHGCQLLAALLNWVDGRARLERFRWQNRHLAMVGDVLTCTGTVVHTDDAGFECDLQEVNGDGIVCAPAWARLAYNHV